MTQTAINEGIILVAELRPRMPGGRGIRYVMRWNSRCAEKFNGLITVGDMTLKPATPEQKAYWWEATENNDRNIIILPLCL